MNRNWLRTALVASAMAAMGPAAAQEVTLHLGHVQQATHPMQLASEHFAELVSEKSNGAIKIIVYPAEQLAGLRAGAEGVQLGTIDMYWPDSGTLGNWQAKYSFVSLPFIFADFDAAVATMDALDEEITQSMREDLNVERLAWSPAGFRVILSTDRKVTSAEDLKGLKIRVPEIPIYVSAFAALDANATPLPWGDVYSALQTGVVEGVEGPPAAILTSNLQEVTSYMARTNHIMTDLNLLMNLDKFNSLKPEYQRILRDAAKEAVNNGLREALRQGEDDAYATLAEALEETDAPDTDSFRAAMAPVYQQFVKEAGPQAAAWIAAAKGE